MRTSLAKSRTLILITAFAVFNTKVILADDLSVPPSAITGPQTASAESLGRQGELTNQANQEAKSGNSSGANELMMMAALAGMEAAAMAAAAQQNQNSQNQNTDQPVQPSQSQTLPDTSSNNPSPSTTPDATMPSTSTDNSSTPTDPTLTTPPTDNAYNNQPVVPTTQQTQDPSALQATQDPNATNTASGTTPLKPIPQSDLSYDDGASTGPGGGSGGSSSPSNNGFGFTPSPSNQAAAATQSGPQADGQGAGASGAGISRSIDTLSATDSGGGGSEGGSSSSGGKSDPFDSVLTSLMGGAAPAGAMPGAGGIEIMPLPKGKHGKPGPNIFQYANFRYKKAAYEESRVRVHFSVSSPKNLAPPVGADPRLASAPSL